MHHNRDIAAALGKTLWTTDSFVPRYRAGEVGSWRINPGGQLSNDWGYYSGQCLLESLPSLARRDSSKGDVETDRWETWMSLTPHEMESQELGFRHAYQNVVVMGLGMGWVAANIGLNPRVTSVTVVERDPEVIELLHVSGAFDSFPPAAQRKMTIVNADALEWCPAEPDTVDFLYVDIWLRIAEPEALSQVRRMQANIDAGTIYFWGQELIIHSAATQFSGDDVPLSALAIKRALTEVIALPLLVPDDCDYSEVIERVIQNRIDRRMEVL